MSEQGPKPDAMPDEEANKQAEASVFDVAEKEFDPDKDFKLSKKELSRRPKPVVGMPQDVIRGVHEEVGDTHTEVVNMPGHVVRAVQKELNQKTAEEENQRVADGELQEGLKGLAEQEQTRPPLKRFEATTSALEGLAQGEGAVESLEGLDKGPQQPILSPEESLQKTREDVETREGIVSMPSDVIVGVKNELAEQDQKPIEGQPIRDLTQEEQAAASALEDFGEKQKTAGVEESLWAMKPELGPTQKNEAEIQAEVALHELDREKEKDAIREAGYLSLDERVHELNNVIKEVKERAETPEDKILNYKEKLIKAFTFLVGSKPGRTAEEPEVLTGGVAGVAQKEEKFLSDRHYHEAQRAYFKLTGKNLDRETKEVAELEAERTGKRIIKKAEFFSDKNRAAFREKAESKNVGRGVRSAWERLTDEQKKQFAGRRADYGVFLEKKRQELGKGRNGIVFTREAYFHLLFLGFDVSKIQKKGVFSSTIEMPMFKTDGTGLSLQKKSEISRYTPADFKKLTVLAQTQAVENIREDASLTMEEAYQKGRRAWTERKLQATYSVIKDSVGVNPTQEQLASRGNAEFEQSTAEARAKQLGLEVIDQKRTEAEARAKERIKDLAVTAEVAIGFIQKVEELSDEDVARFKEAVIKGVGTRPEKIPVKFWNATIKQRIAIVDGFNLEITALNQQRRDYSAAATGDAIEYLNRRMAARTAPVEKPTIRMNTAA